MKGGEVRGGTQRNNYHFLDYENCIKIALFLVLLSALINRVGVIVANGV